MMKLNKIDKEMIMGKLKAIPNACRRTYARFQALPQAQRKAILTHTGAFVAGVACTALVMLMSQYRAHTDGTVATAASAPDTQSTDWGDLVDNMCQTDSPINLLAMKLDFPFSQCQNDNGQINLACVQKDAMRFQPALPQPYQQNLGALETKLGSAEDGSAVLHYYMPLQNAVYQQLPLGALAVNVVTKINGNAPLGWQTPMLVIQGDYSSIKNVLDSHAPKPQTVYYADIPASSDALPGPFNTMEEARIATRKAGGRTAKISKRVMHLEATFQDGLNEVVLSCVPREEK